jgi:hypothetical protein
MKAFEAAQHLIMIAGDEIDRHILGYEPYYVLYHHHVCGRPVTFAELPDVNDVSVENDSAWFYAFQVPEQLGGMAAIGAEVNV